MNVKMKRYFFLSIQSFWLLSVLSWSCSRDIYGESPIPGMTGTQFCENKTQLPENMEIKSTRVSCTKDSTGKIVYCFCFCSPFQACVDGNVYWGHTSRDCQDPYSDSYCGVNRLGTCKKGCRVDCHDKEKLNLWSDHCEENRPKRPGDPCEEDADCSPSTFYADAPNWILIQGYLTCDISLKKCVNVPPPDKKDFMKPCGEPISYENYKHISSPLLSSSKIGHATAPLCEGQVCYVFGDEQKQCVYQGCTRFCEHDRQCPQGSRCVVSGDTLDFKEFTTIRKSKKICLPTLSENPIAGSGPGLLKRYMQCLP